MTEEEIRIKATRVVLSEARELPIRQAVIDMQIEREIEHIKFMNLQRKLNNKFSEEVGNMKL